MLPTTTPSKSEPAPRGCTSFKLRQLARSVGRDYDAALAGTGLKTSQYSLLSSLTTRGPQRPADLAAHMRLDASTLTRNLQPLVAQGWVTIGPGVDQRSRLIHLTDAGRAKRSEAQRAWKTAQLALNARLGPDRVTQLHALIDDCLALLEAGDEEDANDR
jgi:DNA-binding MarR family transcriptional regulator